MKEQAFELNRIRAEKEIERLQEEKKAKLAENKEVTERKNQLTNDKGFFRKYNYDAHQQYQKIASQYKESEKQLKRLKKAQETNQEFLELHQLVTRLEEEQDVIQTERKEKLQETSTLDTKIQIEQNRCAMACQGCGAFSVYSKKAVTGLSQDSIVKARPITNFKQRA